MRKSKLETEQTRVRIVESAARVLRRNGIEGAGVADLMSAAGLTHGGFYKHFDSKEQVVEESLRRAVDAWLDSVDANTARPSAKHGLDSMVADYLSIEHRDDPSGGCPFVALGSELARASPGIRQTATSGYLKLIDAVAERLPALAPAAARKRALFIVSTMVGAMTMARAVSDPELSNAILRQARLQLAQ